MKVYHSFFTVYNEYYNLSRHFGYQPVVIHNLKFSQNPIPVSQRHSSFFRYFMSRHIQCLQKCRIAGNTLLYFRYPRLFCLSDVLSCQCPYADLMSYSSISIPMMFLLPPLIGSLFLLPIKNQPSVLFLLYHS
jgi:hypothetical protein